MIVKKSNSPATVVKWIGSSLYAYAIGWWTGESDQDPSEKHLQNILPVARELAIRTFRTMSDDTINIISSADARYNIQEVLLSGHSLGGNGVLSSILRLQQEIEQGKIKDTPNRIQGYMFNSPGGLLGCKAAANDLSEKDTSSIPIYQIFRKSCIVGRNARFFGFKNIKLVELSPYTKTDDKSFKNWFGTLLDEHRISHLKKEIEEAKNLRQGKKRAF